MTRVVAAMPERGPLNDVAAILNATHPHYRGPDERPDNCPDCQSLRRTTFRCRSCLYVGAPAVLGCTCARQHAGRIADYKRYRQEAIETGTACLGAYTQSDVEGELATMEALPRPRRCRAIPDDTSASASASRLASRKREAATEAGERADGCAHGMMQCPVCWDYGEGGDRDHGYKMIRDLRRLLRSLGIQA